MLALILFFPAVSNLTVNWDEAIFPAYAGRYSNKAHMFSEAHIPPHYNKHFIIHGEKNEQN